MSNKRTELMNNILQELAKIKTTNGYNFDIKTLEEGLKLPEDVDPGQFPAAFVVDGDEQKRDYDACSLQAEIDYIITCYVSRVDNTTDLQQLRRNFQEDVEKALMADRSRGGIADSTTPIRIETDKATLEQYAIADMTFRIKYNHPVNQP
jgi:hypothetical protein